MRNPKKTKWIWIKIKITTNPTQDSNTIINLFLRSSHFFVDFFFKYLNLRMKLKSVAIIILRVKLCYFCNPTFTRTIHSDQGLRSFTVCGARCLVSRTNCRQRTECLAISLRNSKGKCTTTWAATLKSYETNILLHSYLIYRTSLQSASSDRVSRLDAGCEFIGLHENIGCSKLIGNEDPKYKEKNGKDIIALSHHATE